MCEKLCFSLILLFVQVFEATIFLLLNKLLHNLPSFRGLHINHPWFGLALGRNLDYLSKVESQLYTSKTRSVEANLQQLDTVNMSAQAALKSQDIAQVKKGRATIKSQLTTAQLLSRGSKFCFLKKQEMTLTTEVLARLS